MASQLVFAAVPIGALVLLVWRMRHDELVAQANELAEIVGREE